MPVLVGRKDTLGSSLDCAAVRLRCPWRSRGLTAMLGAVRSVYQDRHLKMKPPTLVR